MMLNSVLLLAFYLAFHAPLVTCSFNWASFPVCAQPAMEDNAPQSCDYGADVSSTNFCLCSDNSFIDGAATEIYTSCGCGVLTTSAETLYTLCTEYAPGALQLTMAEIVYAGDGGQSVCGNGNAASTPTSTAAAAPETPSTSPTSNSNAGGGGSNTGSGGGAPDLSIGGIIGIVAGICTIIGLPVTIWMCCRQRS